MGYNVIPLRYVIPWNCYCVQLLFGSTLVRRIWAKYVLGDPGIISDVSQRSPRSPSGRSKPQKNIPHLLGIGSRRRLVYIPIVNKTQTLLWFQSFDIQTVRSTLTSKYDHGCVTVVQNDMKILQHVVTMMASKIPNPLAKALINVHKYAIYLVRPSREENNSSEIPSNPWK